MLRFLFAICHPSTNCSVTRIKTQEHTRELYPHTIPPTPFIPVSASLSRFMPRVEIVQKHNTAARRLYIRGHNGKIYPYLVMNDACLTESRREERVLQLLRLLNPCLEKRKETTKRHLFFTGEGRPRVCTRVIHDQGRPAKTKGPNMHQYYYRRSLCFCPLSSASLSLTVSNLFQAPFPLPSAPRGFAPPRCLPTLHICA